MRLDVQRIRRVLRRPPGYLASRVMDAARRRARRPWAYVYRSLMTDRALLRACGSKTIDGLWSELAQQPFFVSPSARIEAAARFRESYAAECDTILRHANAALRHEFDLLGSGPVPLGDRLPWHTDFKTGRQWPLAYCTDIEYNELDRPTDVKVPWELSRCQHFTRLGQAFWLTGDERYAAEFVAETTDWLDANPFSIGVNWACAMDVALRAVSWIWGFYFFADAEVCRDRTFRSRFLRGLFVHGEFIVKHLEKYDLNGNHYLCDGVGLVFLGCLFKRASAARKWLALGRSIVIDEIFTQTTPDGVDFEVSTAYHRLVLEAFLTAYELLRLHGDPVPPRCLARLERMCAFVQAYTKPNGRAPLFGDADDGRIQILGSQPITDHRYLLSTAALLFDDGSFKRTAGRCWEETFWLRGMDAPERFARIDVSPEPGSQAFPDGGFYVLRGAGSHLVIDCGPVGFGGRGGHGHNDILSFELFLNGLNVVTDCGAYLYTASRDWRNRFRSTAFHNTVQVDGEELNRFLAPDALWQLHDDARPVDVTFDVGERADRFGGGHTGYARLQPPVTHMRTCSVDKDRPRVLVCDRVCAGGRQSLVWRFHLDPSVTTEVHGLDVRLASGDRAVWVLPSDSAASFTLSVEEGWVSPSYGVKLPASVLVWSATGGRPIEASFLFAETHLNSDERRAVVDALRSSSFLNH